MNSYTAMLYEAYLPSYIVEAELASYIYSYIGLCLLCYL